MPDTTEIEFYRGDAYGKEITITDEATGVAIDLTGYTLTMYVDSEKTPDSPSTTEKFQLIGVVAEPLLGKVVFTPSVANNNLNEDIYYYRVKMTADAGVTLRTVKRDQYKII